MVFDLTGLKVLVVEDNGLEALAMEAVLKAAEVEVVGVVATVQKALALAANAEMDAVLLDVNLHGEMAYPVADRLLARGIPFVLVTGYAAREIPMRYFSHALCSKPWSAERLLKHLSQAVAAARSRSA
jgi:CheY-like chemotaxis protein